MFADALRLEKGRLAYVSEGQIAFSPTGSLQKSSWSLEALRENGSWELIQMPTRGRG